MKKLKIIFMGTPEFAVPILDEIAKIHEIVLVITQPDKIVGRKKQIEFSPVKKRATELGIEVYQPNDIRQEDHYCYNFPCDLIVTAAYGQIIGMKLLEYPLYKAINVHASLLPKYRGGAPIQRALMNNEDYTGITIMYMAKGMDTGDILRMEKLKIENDDNSDSLFKKLSLLGKEIINSTIEQLINGQIIPRKQNDREATYAKNISKKEELIDFNQNAKSVFGQIRALADNPGSYFVLENIVYKVYDSKIINKKTVADCGVIIDVTKDDIQIACSEGTVIAITKIKPEGRNVMTVKDFLNGKGKNIFQINKKIANIN